MYYKEYVKNSEKEVWNWIWDRTQDTDIYAFAYKEDERALNLICKPVKGKIHNGFFFEYKKDSVNLKKNGVRASSRYFADTYEEAVVGYNKLIDERINKLEYEISRLKTLKVEVCE